ncbi:hypothetical protein R1X32_09050 (plasmid) [Rhodococcus opacus]|uniref:hypothetical protein n=1 Tax=Rhodococcus opacus TaxID=37919 RepID=UPI0002A209D8|nr:hypothetical protein [Rhodococcus opacus]ELB85892.1 hypothetical protein Rwratislav_47794 [Rhodococcus wratislaviensis IFP 2016]MDV6248019.1 hypothetical protein [Rhodococcus opacus]WKN59890.1 hypothetical protein HJ581_0039250 [Rhodococcus opacus]
MPHFRYVGTHERIHLGAATRMINYGDIVAAQSNPDPRYFELVEPDQVAEPDGTDDRRSMGAPEPK